MLALAAIALVAPSCGKADDPRVGEKGRIRFVGGGCSGTTVMAVGSRVTLELQSATNEGLPDHLGVVSEAPAVIEARMNLDPQKIDLAAHAEGDSMVSIESDGETVDSIELSAAPAAFVKFESVTRALEGGTVGVKVTDVHGDCGDDCPLMGESFLGWRVEPAAGGDFVVDLGGIADFRMGGPGDVTLVGREPVRGADLVSQMVTVVAAADATGLVATLTTVPFDPAVTPVSTALPGKMTRTDAFSVRVDATGSFDGTVPIGRGDVAWRVEGDPIALEVPVGPPGDPREALFLVGGTGKVTLTATVAIVNLEQAFDVTIE